MIRGGDLLTASSRRMREVKERPWQAVKVGRGSWDRWCC